MFGTAFASRTWQNGRAEMRSATAAAGRLLL